MPKTSSLNKRRKHTQNNKVINQNKRRKQLKNNYSTSNDWLPMIC